MMKILTVSVDDGHPTDLRTAALLRKYGLKATFYVPAQNPEREVLAENDIKQLSKEFEIGGHTLNHRPLVGCSQDTVWEEINGGKIWLEDLLGLQVRPFCYPQGRFNSSIAQKVKDAGFLGARTCMFNLSAWPTDPFRWGVSTHAYPHSCLIQIRHALRENNFHGIVGLATIHKFARDWTTHFMHAVDWVERRGGIAHLFFHSWEIDSLGQWNELERVLEQISRRTELKRMTNGELFSSFYDEVNDDARLQ